MSGDAVVTAILGGRGMLGTDLAAACRQKGIAYEVFDLPEFDITNAGQLDEVIKNHDAIINCAAYTNVDGAETERELAYKVNAEAVKQLGRLAAQRGKYVLHISTDFVFDGKLDRPYVETDEPNPISEYGRSKLMGEQGLVESGCSNCIMRVEWTYGAAGKNFVKKLLQRARETGKLKVVDDQIGSPTATTEAAAAICDLLRKRPQGLFHFAAAGYVSRFEMARFIIDKLKLDVELKSCKSSEFASPAARPLNSRFCCDRIAAILDRPIRPWQGPLEEYLKTL
jgi:dTDP-4-dehydrorhamnose reductase